MVNRKGLSPQYDSSYLGAGENAKGPTVAEALADMRKVEIFRQDLLDLLDRFVFLFSPAVDKRTAGKNHKALRAWVL